MAVLDNAFNIHDLRDLARARLPKWLFEFVDRGTEDEVALRNNREAFDRIKLKPRVLRDVSPRKLDTTLFGKTHKLPIAIAPTGAAGMMWYLGELELAKAARDAGMPFTLATGSITSMEKIAREVGGTLWMQLYMFPDRKLSLELIKRAENAGFEALLVTCDTPVTGNREYNLRNGFSVPFEYNRRNTLDVLSHPRWLFGTLGRYMVNGGMPRHENFPESLRKTLGGGFGAAGRRNDTLTWEDLKMLRDNWKGKLVAKGILDAEDAELAIANGADGVVVSNHGGRGLDATMAPIDVLPEVVRAVGHKTTVIVDSGFRRGTDVVKALSLGAKMVLVGRGTLFGTAVAGGAGAAKAIHFYREEMLRTMAMCGVTSVEQMTHELLDCVGERRWE